MKEMLVLTIKGRIPSKKNSRVSAGRYTVASGSYRQWSEYAALQILEHKGKMLSNVDVQFEFWMW